MNTDGSCDTRNSTTSSTAPSEPSSSALPTAASPFGPVRKNQPTPPVKIPGQRKPSDHLPPRPVPPTSRYAPNPEQIASWWDHAEKFLGDAWDQHAADNAFGGAA